MEFPQSWEKLTIKPHRENNINIIIKVMGLNNHSYGQPDENKRGNPSTAVATREFYKWAEAEATESELKEYEADESKPFARRRFVSMLLKATNMHEMFSLCNQIHGRPAQAILGQNEEVPPIIVNYVDASKTCDKLDT